MTRLLVGILIGLAISAAVARAEGPQTIRVTGYLATGHNTASGLPVGPGVAACPQSFPFGTRLHLSGKLEIDVECWDRTPGDPWLIDVFVRYYREAIGLTGYYSWSYREEE